MVTGATTDATDDAVQANIVAAGYRTHPTDDYSHTSLQAVPRKTDDDSDAADVLVTETDSGAVRGALDGGVYAVKGVPYARAPLGKLRWQPPAAVQRWPGELQAHDFRPACAQFGGPQPGTGSEDCLFLNIWTPKHPSLPGTEPGGEQGSLLPVVVFLHGGDNTQGKPSWYNMSALSREGNVVAVSVAYRLNIFGFFSARELASADERGVSGNYGLLDTQESCRWLRKNVARFGGDPDRITLVGQSSGGTNILALLGSPASQGLFHRAISLSGSPNISYSGAKMQEVSRPVVAALNCSTSPQDDAKGLECLLGKSTAELLAAAATKCIGDSGCFDENGLNSLPDCKGGGDSCFGPGKGLATMPGLVTIDGVTVTKPLFEALRSGVTDIPTIWQTQAQEAALGPAEDDRNMTTAEFTQRLAAAFKQWPSITPEKILALYRPELDLGGPQMVYESIVGDLRVTCGNIALAKTAAGRPSTSKQYSTIVVARPSHPVFIFDGAAFGICNSAHFLDLESLLGNIGNKGGCCDKPTWKECSPMARCIREGGNGGPGYAERESDRAETATLRKYLLEFAATGEVRGWPTAERGGVLLNNSVAASVLGLRHERCGMWAAAGFGPEFWWAN